MTDYTHKKGIIYKNQYHIIFCTKYRRQVITDEIEARLKEILQEKVNELPIEMKAMEVMPDHIHLFLECDPRIAIHQVIKKLKGATSHILREEFPSLKTRIPSLWTRSYFLCTVGHINEETIIRYIEEQKNK